MGNVWLTIRIADDNIYTMRTLLYMIEVYTQNMYNGDIIMIKSFKNLETMRIYEQHYVKRIPVDVSRIALRKLIMMDNAENINDLRIPPGNRLEKLSGDREGQYSIRINDKYRICFQEIDNEFYDVEIVDYH